MKINRHLEKLIRGWAMDSRSHEDESVLEASNVNYDAFAVSASRRLSIFAPIWILFWSEKTGDLEFLLSENVTRILSTSFSTRRMISLVDPLTGGGVTIDVSDEGGDSPVLQIAGWGSCLRFVKELSEDLSEILWISSSQLGSQMRSGVTESQE